MPEKFLHRADVITGLQHLSRETVPQRMRRCRLVHLRQSQRPFEGTLESRVMHMMPPLNAAARVRRQ